MYKNICKVNFWNWKCCIKGFAHLECQQMVLTSPSKKSHYFISHQQYMRVLASLPPYQRGHPGFKPTLFSFKVPKYLFKRTGIITVPGAIAAVLFRF